MVYSTWLSGPRIESRFSERSPYFSFFVKRVKSWTFRCSFADSPLLRMFLISHRTNPSSQACMCLSQYWIHYDLVCAFKLRHTVKFKHPFREFITHIPMTHVLNESERKQGISNNVSAANHTFWIVYGNCWTDMLIMAIYRVFPIKKVFIGKKTTSMSGQILLS